ncbi:hypothetical protein HBI56_189760 [Parastagonospora nodorum]|uniref:Uncharacterized protein n=1 Tax=Phaeosphaeria nodorum (strain SN15 / ATCC MYA-4574 / FGSC 10173) TaxID=321614 RepID=A0A7U2F9V7_PHANO|nr:hypothetical protein HBH56_144700 [Parastagonospora nodorum]QRD01388.1 hypothetical protein JI435_416530 [Parastagonospora nodorum SN15]KAH3927820.1 hypothetical protein HBH54_149890 [Parastagonospora nodorum]KAH3948033.1 hypothetical protein HBH53_109930 [Parastagonospora nodorum]KAH3960212.1 hypothetical protein HBH51_193750 [Parastagonospora nodorum]
MQKCRSTATAKVCGECRSLMALAADRAVSEPLRRCLSLRALRRGLSFASVRAHLLNWWSVHGWLLCGRCTQWVDRR